MYNVRTPDAHFFRRSGISTMSPSLLISLRWYWFWVTQCETEEEVLGRDGWVGSGVFSGSYMILILRLSSHWALLLLMLGLGLGLRRLMLGVGTDVRLLVSLGQPC